MDFHATVVFSSLTRLLIDVLLSMVLLSMVLPWIGPVFVSLPLVLVIYAVRYGCFLSGACADGWVGLVRLGGGPNRGGLESVLGVVSVLMVWPDGCFLRLTCVAGVSMCLIRNGMGLGGG